MVSEHVWHLKLESLEIDTNMERKLSESNAYACILYTKCVT